MNFRLLIVQPNKTLQNEEYAKVLRENEELIRWYWQAGGRENQYNDPATAPHAVALVDIMGDETPELFFIASMGKNTAECEVFIYTTQFGKAKQVGYVGHLESYHILIFEHPTANCYYQLPGSKDLYALITCDQDTEFHHWYSKDGLTLYHEAFRAYTNATEIPSYYGYSEETGESYEMDEAQFNALMEQVPKNAERLVTYSYVSDEGTGEILLDGRDAIEADGVPCVAMTYDEAIAFLSGELDSDAGSTAAMDAPASSEVASLPAELIDVEMTHFTWTTSGVTVAFHADNSFDFRSYDEEGCVYYYGQIDRVEKRSEYAYVLHVASTGVKEGQEYTDEVSPFAAGETLTVVLPGGGLQEITGELLPTFDQDYNGYEASYVPECCYIGKLGRTGIPTTAPES